MTFNVEVFDGADPLGLPLGTISNRATKVSVRVEDNGNGAIGVEVNRHDDDFDLVQPGNYAVVTSGDIPDLREGYWIAEGQDVVAGPNGAGGDRVTRAGRGAIGYMVEGIIGTEDATAAGYRTWTGSTWGAIMLDLIADAQGRGEIAAMTVDFDATNDSGGVPWVPLVGEFRLNVGLNLLAVIEKVRAGGVTVRMSAELVLRMWQTIGEDVSAIVRFNVPGNIIDIAQREVHASEPMTAVLLQGAAVDGGPFFHWYVDAAFEAIVGRRVAGFAQVQSSNDTTYLDAVGRALVNRTKFRREGPTTMGVKIGVNMAALLRRARGEYMPFTDYTVGDTVDVDVPGVFDHAKPRVAAITLVLLDGGFLPLLEYSDAPASDLPLPPEVAAQVAAGGGGAGGGAGGAGGGGGSWQGADPCSDCADTTTGVPDDCNGTVMVPGTDYGPCDGDPDLGSTVETLYDGEGAEIGVTGTGPISVIYNGAGANTGPGALGLSGNAAAVARSGAAVAILEPLEIVGTAVFPATGVHGTTPLTGRTGFGYRFLLAPGRGPIAWGMDIGLVTDDQSIGVIYEQGFDSITDLPAEAFVRVITNANEKYYPNDLTPTDYEGVGLTVHFRAQSDGTTFRAKVWVGADSEPGSWMIEEAHAWHSFDAFYVQAEGVTQDGDGTERLEIEWTFDGQCPGIVPGAFYGRPFGPRAIATADGVASEYPLPTSFDPGAVSFYRDGVLDMTAVGDPDAPSVTFDPIPDEGVKLAYSTGRVPCPEGGGGGS